MASELTEWRPFSEFAELRHPLDQVFRVLPQGVKAEDIEAKCRDGVLEVIVPVPKAEKKQAIEIKPESD